MTTKQCVLIISAPVPVPKRVYVKVIPGYPLKDDECLELHYTIYDLEQLPRAYYFLCQENVYTNLTYTVID